jgi:hypothetical protein
METRIRPSSCAGVAALVAVALLPTLAAAQATQSGATPDAWHYEASVYLYLPSVGGTTRFPVDGGGSSINISADKIIDSLQFGFMGAFDAHKGSWGAFTDVIYLDLAASKSQSRDFTIGNIGLPAGTSADLRLGLTGWVWSLAGEYRVVAEPDLKVDLLAGARLVDLTSRLDWTISGNLGPISPASRAGSSEASKNIGDAIVGIRGQRVLGAGQKWSLPFYLDAGAGGSAYTWQGAVGVGYPFRWGAVAAMWRYLGYKFDSGSNIQSVNFNGPQISATFRW